METFAEYSLKLVIYKLKWNMVVKCINDNCIKVLNNFLKLLNFFKNFKFSFYPKIF